MFLRCSLLIVLLVCAVELAASQPRIARDFSRSDHPIVGIDFPTSAGSPSETTDRRKLKASVSQLDSLTGTPRLRLTAFGECELNLALPRRWSADVSIKELRANGAPGIWWRYTSKERVQLYQRKDGNLELEVCLDSTPSDNRFTFPIQSRNLVFCYQPELTKQERLQGTIRPDSVVGSYAVYRAAGVEDGDTSASAYGTGKAFHIFRPRAHDADGATTWCDISIDTALTVTVPWAFLKIARYPVVVDPTFGYQEAGASLAILSSARANINDDHTRVAASNEVITSMSVHASGSAGSPSISMAVYSMDNGSPKLPVTRLANPVSTTVPDATAAWRTINNLSLSLTSGTRYCLAIGEVGTGIYVSFDTYISTARSSGPGSALPATWSSSSVGPAVYSLYATYGVTTGSTPLRRRRVFFANQ